MTKQKKVVVIGAGVGGLTTAALLAQAGLDVTVLEAHVYPGGCAGTFYHKKYRFDAGATLAGGFYPGGPMDIVAKAVGIKEWPLADEPDDAPAMTVHFPDGSLVHRYGGPERWDHREEAFGPQAANFFKWQEQTADLLWDFALRTPPWPPQSPMELSQLIAKGSGWLLSNLKAICTSGLSLTLDSIYSVRRHLGKQSEKLRLFIDAQLLIASQTTSQNTNALYGASALDLPRRGVVHLHGGIGAIAETIADAFRNHGGQLVYREEVQQIRMENGLPIGVETKRGNFYPADIVIANLPPWNIRKLLDEASIPAKLRNLAAQPEQGGSAFMTYVGVDESVLPKETPLHHQVIVREPMGEGNTVFLSLSPADDTTRAPAGKRAITISTHTHIGPWWQLFHEDPDRYNERKQHYTNILLDAAERVFPDLRQGADLIKPGTPVTFQRFTRREWGWVGGFPQVNLFQAWGPRLGKDLWMVGDTIFPGQSTAAVALGGLRVANTILSGAGLPTVKKLNINDNLNLVDSAGSASYG